MMQEWFGKAKLGIFIHWGCIYRLKCCKRFTGRQGFNSPFSWGIKRTGNKNGIKTKIKKITSLASGNELSHTVLGGAPWLDMPGCIWIDVS